MAYEKDPDELGALWRHDGPKGEYWTGSIGDLKVVVFPNAHKRSEKSPDMRVMKSKPKAAPAPASADDDPLGF